MAGALPGRDALGPEASGGTLYVVATPIGNLGDITLRALEVLRTVAVVAAEDTRITRRLFARHEINTRLTSFHGNSGPAKLGALLARLRANEDVALVTDAGTPIVSDPGEDLVSAWAAEGGAVVAIPGASAVLAAVASSGIAGARWGFEGFLPRSGRERKDRLARIATDDRSTVLFEAPGRLGATLRDLAAACGGDRRAAVCRELTKLHEQVARGALDELVALVGSGIPERGEIVIVVAGGSARAATGEDDAGRLSSARARVDALVRDGSSRSDAARRVAGETGLPRRDLYGGSAPS